MTTETTETLELATALVRLSHLVRHVFADVSRDHGLTPQQTQLLCVLVDGPLGMTELRRLLHLERSGLTGLVDRVERRELIARLRDPRDRRAFRIALTDQGTLLAVRAHDDVVERLDAMIREVLPSDRAHLAQVISRILAENGLSGGPRRPV